MLRVRGELWENPVQIQSFCSRLPAELAEEISLLRRVCLRREVARNQVGDAREGGQAPYAIYRLALASGLFADLGQVNTLGLLRRL